MATDLMADGSPFAGRFVVSMITDGTEVGADASTHDIGTICEVRTAEQFPDGRWMLIGVGVARARVAPVESASTPVPARRGRPSSTTRSATAPPR